MSESGGLYVATLTPFDSVGRVDLGALRRHVTFLLDGGVDGLSPCGTTGETLYLSTGERVRVLEETVRAAVGRVPVMAGVWALTPSEVALLSRAAAAAGASAVFLPPPIYYPATDDVILRWYATAGESSKLPVFAYNIPAYAANSISLECLERMAGEGIVAGIKDSTGSAERIGALVQQFGKRIIVMAASDSFATEGRKLGARGFISALANAWPQSFARLWAGDETLQPAVDAVRKVVKEAGGIAAIKYLAGLRGYYMGACRLPFSELSDAQRQALDAAAQKAAEAGLT